MHHLGAILLSLFGCHHQTFKRDRNFPEHTSSEQQNGTHTFALPPHLLPQVLPLLL
jgi:hypothetical protein